MIHKEACLAILDEIIEDYDSEAFREEVPWKELGLLNYPKIIKKPMDLSTIKNKLINNKYKRHQDFALDVRLVWSNCMTYNDEDSPLYKVAVSFSDSFEEEYNLRVIKGIFDGDNENNNKKKYDDDDDYVDEEEEETILPKNNKSPASTNNKVTQIKKNETESESDDSFSFINNKKNMAQKMKEMSDNEEEEDDEEEGGRKIKTPPPSSPSMMARVNKKREREKETIKKLGSSYAVLDNKNQKKEEVEEVEIVGTSKGKKKYSEAEIIKMKRGDGGRKVITLTYEEQLLQQQKLMEKQEVKDRHNKTQALKKRLMENKKKESDDEYDHMRNDVEISDDDVRIIEKSEEEEEDESEKTTVIYFRINDEPNEKIRYKIKINKCIHRGESETFLRKEKGIKEDLALSFYFQGVEIDEDSTPKIIGIVENKREQVVDVYYEDKNKKMMEKEINEDDKSALGPILKIVVRINGDEKNKFKAQLRMLQPFKDVRDGIRSREKLDGSKIIRLVFDGEDINDNQTPQEFDLEPDEDGIIFDAKY